jgi:ribosome modulation factor
MAMNEYYQQGWDAYLVGLDIMDNPYDYYDSYKRVDWVEGWSDAKEEHEAMLDHGTVPEV